MLDPILVDAAAEAGAEVRYGVTVTDVRRDDHGRVCGIVGRDAHGRALAVDAGIVVGADGVRSTIADRVDAPIERAGTGATAVVYGYWSGLDTDGYEWIFRPHAMAGVIPTNDGQACVFAGGDPARASAPAGSTSCVEVLADAAPDVAARVDAATAPAGVRTFRGFPASSDGPGDRAGRSSATPATGRTRSASTASPTPSATPSCSPGRSSPPNPAEPDRAEALADYQATRDRLSDQLFDVVDTIAAQHWTDDEIPGLLLQLSSSMADEVETLAALDAVAVP